ncbi:uncharacterized protein isoform X2 [Musca autumnalis]|uniref:uncharacterized protein isoform X2 n=1 Tax=Musca autumnalis TaxID=221902 RepID=UPI003CF8C03E
MSSVGGVGATSSCLYCKSNGKEKDFHSIFEADLEDIQLPELISKFFGISVEYEKDKKHELCDDCLNRLIELYDLEEHNKELNSVKREEVYRSIKEERKDFVENQINKEQGCNNGNENQDRDHTSYIRKVRDSECKTDLRETRSESPTNEDAIQEYDTPEEDIYDDDGNYLQSRTTSETAAANEEENTYDSDSQMYSFVSEDANHMQSTIISKAAVNEEENIYDGVSQLHSSVSHGLKHNEQQQEGIGYEYDDAPEISANTMTEPINEEGDEYNEDNYIDPSPTEQANNVFQVNSSESTAEEYPDDSAIDYYLAVDEPPQGEETELMAYKDQNEESETYVEEFFCQNSENGDDDDDEENDQTLVYIENDEMELNELSGLVELTNENDNTSRKIYEEEQNRTEQSQTMNDNQAVTDEIIARENIPNDTVNDTDFFETEENSADASESNENLVNEEYYEEEIITSEDYDKIDITEYLDNVILTNFDELQLEWEVECNLCLCKYPTFQELLEHSCIIELLAEEQEFSCIATGCQDIVTNLKTLARHLLIKHYENIESIPVYGRCPDCQKPFSNICDFNKHSCSDIKRKPGIRNYCQMCNLHFQSLKRFVFHMQFHLSKHRPKVCVICSSLFNNIDDFFEHVTYSHEPATAMACIKCDRFFQDENVFEQHMFSHENKYVYECLHCPKKYTNQSGLTSHMDVHHNHHMKPLQCDHCYKIYVNQHSYRSHIKSHMPEPKITAFICSECGLMSNNEEDMQDHIENEETAPDATGELIEKVVSGAFTCECCSLDFYSPEHLQKHRRTPQHNDNLYYCPMCRKAFKTLKHMRNHMSNHKDYDEWLNKFPIVRSYMCNIGDCMDAYPLWSSLYYHKKRHKDTPTPGHKYPCQFCEKVCDTKMSLAVHIARVHNNNNIKCQHCKKSYKTDKELKEHLQRMHVTVQCQKCDKVFKNQRNLTSHEQLVHENKKRYFCSHCEKGYYYQSELKAHEKNVHPNTTYNCELCNFVTTYPKSLEIHRVSKHTEEFPFQCEFCKKGFARKQLLVMHMKRHKLDKDFICNENCDGGCSASFISYFLLKKHIEEEHSTTVSTSQQKDERKLQRKSQQKVIETIRSRGGRKRKQREILVVENNSGDVEFILGESVNNDEDDITTDNELENQDDDNTTITEEGALLNELMDDNQMDYEEMQE